MNLGVPSAAGLADGLWPVFFRAPVPSGCTLILVLSSDTTIVMRDMDKAQLDVTDFLL